MHVSLYLYEVLKEIKQSLQSEGHVDESRQRRGTAPSTVNQHTFTETYKPKIYTV